MQDVEHSSHELYHMVDPHDVAAFVQRLKPLVGARVFRALSPAGVLTFDTYADGAVPFQRDVSTFAITSRDAPDRIAADAFLRHNFRMRYIRLAAFFTFAYAAKNRTAASAALVSPDDQTYITLQSAIRHSRQDAEFPRSGPYALLVNSVDRARFWRALPYPGVTFYLGSETVKFITYDGSPNTSDALATRYPGIPAGKAYLIDFVPYLRFRHHVVLERQPMQHQPLGDHEEEISSEFGLYCNPSATTQEITLPDADE